MFMENWSFGTSLYFIFITLTTIGFGDIVPQNSEVCYFKESFLSTKRFFEKGKAQPIVMKNFSFKFFQGVDIRLMTYRCTEIYAIY